jgi:hypothetical protein
LNNTFDGEAFIMSVPFVVTSVEFDPERHLISRNSAITLGNQSFELDNAITVYPNPSSEILHIQMPTTLALEKAIIYNSLGQKVLESTTLDFAVNSLSSGVHYIDIQTADGIYHKKFIKK